MVNIKGLASYCQDCGACTAQFSEIKISGMDSSFVESIIDEVVRTVRNGQTGLSAVQKRPMIPLGVSNRHIHLTEDTLHRLFGREAVLQKYRQLYQPDDFASKQTVALVGTKMRAIENVRILGPLRHYNQVELSATDAIYLGIKPPVRNSGDLNGASPLTLIGPAGSVYLPDCAIIAARHIHMSDQEAESLGVKNGDLCSVRLNGEKPTIFEKVLIRSNDSWRLQLHLDTDEANATGSRCGTQAELLA